MHFLGETIPYSSAVSSLLDRHVGTRWTISWKSSFWKNLVIVTNDACNKRSEHRNCVELWFLPSQYFIANYNNCLFVWSCQQDQCSSAFWWWRDKRFNSLHVVYFKEFGTKWVLYRINHFTLHSMHFSLAQAYTRRFYFVPSEIHTDAKRFAAILVLFWTMRTTW